MKQFLSITLSILLLLSQVHITFGAHYCGGLKVEDAISIGHSDMSCGIAMEDMQSETCELSLTKKPVPCCHDTHNTISIDLEGHIIKGHIDIPVYALSPAIEFDLGHLVIPEVLHALQPNPPPLLPSGDLMILHQVFLI